MFDNDTFLHKQYRKTEKERVKRQSSVDRKNLAGTQQSMCDVVVHSSYEQQRPEKLSCRD